MNEKKHIQLRVDLDSQKANQHRMSGMSEVYFPCEPYPQQANIVQTIHQGLDNGQNVLIDSPTGTGKTLSLLIGVLSYFASTGRPTKIFYLTRTHSQINQVVAELKRTCYRFKLAIITAKDSMCINPNLREMRGRELDRRC
jgi:regulator of telomere elongation helicase 1